MDELLLPIEGMSCGGCVASVRRALEAVPQTEIVSIEVGKAVVRTEQRDAVVSAIEDAGFDVVRQA